MKSSADLGGRYLQHSSYPTKDNSIIVLLYSFKISPRSQRSFAISAHQENTTQPCPQVFFDQRFNNLQWAALLTSFAQYDKVLSKFGQQRLIMVNYVCGFNQSQTGIYLE